MDREQLRTLWQQTLPPGFDLDAANPRATLRPFDVAAGGPLPRLGGGGYDIETEIGRGGMGVVYRARQSRLDRQVAVKKIQPARRSDEKARRDFLAEALVTGQLDHPNIVPVYDLDEGPDGQIYLSMKLVGGRSWREILSASTAAEHRGADLDRELDILLSVANAVAFAHSRGIVHRDLKPENVMVGEFGEVLVMDWGLAVDFRDPAPADAVAPHRSTVRKPAGTPQYMAPELAEGRGDDIGPRTDVYLLGAILHEVLTGRPPHDGETIFMVILAASRSAAPEYGPDVPAELAAIARRAMAPDPRDRFRSIADLQAAIRAYRKHRESTVIASAASGWLAAAREGAREELTQEARSGVYSNFARAIAGFEQALVLWDENTLAREGEIRARLAYAKTALDAGDFGLARAQLHDLEDDAEAFEIETAAAAGALSRERSARTTRLLRRSLAAAAVTIIVGLGIGTVLVSRKSDEAAASAADAQAKEKLANANAARADANAAEALVNLHRANEEQARTSIAYAGNATLHGRWQVALHEYGKAREVGYSDGIEIEIGEIEALEGLGRVDEATAKLAALRGRDDLGRHRAKVELLQGDYPVDRSVDPEAGREHIEAALRLGGLDAADEAYARALIAPTVPEARTLLRSAFTGGRWHRRAAESYAAILSLMGEVDELGEHVIKMTAIYPDDPVGSIFKTAWLMMTDRDEEAKALLATIEGTDGVEVPASAWELLAIVAVAGTQVDDLYAAGLLGDQADFTRAFLRAMRGLPVLRSAMQKVWDEDAKPAVDDLESEYRKQDWVRYPMSLMTGLVETARATRGLFSASVPLDLQTLTQASEPEPAEVEAVIAGLTRAIAVLPSGYNYFLRGGCHYRLDRYADAERDLRTAVAVGRGRIIPKSCALMLLAVQASLVQTTQDPVALEAIKGRMRETLELALVQSDWTDFQHSNITSMAFFIGAFDLAGKLIERWRVAFPDSAKAIAFDGRTRHREGAYARAVVLLDRALSLEPENQDFARWRQEAFDRVGMIGAGEDARSKEDYEAARKR